MTISSTTVRNSYSGDGSTTTFSYTFKIFQDSDIQVIIRSANGTETTKTITTHYTVTGAGNSGGGSVIFTSGNIPTATQTVVLRRNIPQTQAIDYIANDPFPAESHEEGLDRATMAIQQLQEEVTRSLKLSKTNTMTSTEFTVGASDRANKILAFDTNGELSVTQELGTNRGNWATATTFNARDIVKDSSNNNVYIANTTHTSVGTTPISSNADVAKWDLIVDAQAATNAANNASNHASNSSNFANNSSNSANASANHASNSSNFANNSSNSANSASSSLAGVSANANAAANSAANSSNFANNSSNSANSSSNHSSNSSNFANNSSNSANTSSNHASNSSNFANNSSNSANTSSNHSANSSNFANNSSNSANTSANHASNSSNHASNSSNHSANSSNFANTSSNHSANSSNFANNSSNFANTASNAANAANAARDTAITLVDNFEDVYLGSKITDPSLDNDGDALTAGDLYYNSVGNVLKYYTGSAWVAITSGGITDLVQDTTPQLGGMLDVNGQSIGDGTLELVKFAETASAVNEITVTNSATGNAPEIAATGDDTNIDLKLTPKGTGKLNLDGIKFPNADGSAGQFLKTDGSGVLSFAAAGRSGAVDWDTTKKTSGFTAVSGVGYFCDTTSSAFTVTLPATPSAGDIVAIADYDGTASTNNITVGRNSSNINGDTSNLIITKNYAAISFVYVDATAGWRSVDTSNIDNVQNPFIVATGGTETICGDYKIHSFTGPGTFTVTNVGTPGGSNTVDYLVVGGGGGAGARWHSGGGGAGGFRESVPSPAAWTASPLANPGGALPVSVTAYPITVGAGGSGGASCGNNNGTNGNTSIFSTITAALGGRGGTYNTGGNSGGSGGGSGSGTGPAVGGTGNTPPVAPPQGNNGGNGQTPAPGGGGAGGGGAGGVGSNFASPDVGGNGGAGVSTSISGSSTGFAGGSAGAGPNGGGSVPSPAWGSKASNPAGAGENARANSGSGGGTVAQDIGPTAGGSGGSGIVVIRYKFQ